MASAKKELENTDTTETAEVKEKAAPGTSVPAQCRSIVLAVAGQFEDYKKAETGPETTLEDAVANFIFDLGTMEHILTLAAEIRSNAQRGLPLEDQLKKINAEMTEHWATLAIVDGVAAPTDEWEDRKAELTQAKRRIVNAIAKRDAPAEEAATEVEATPEVTA